MNETQHKILSVDDERYNISVILGGDRLLRKPFAQQELLEAIEELRHP